MHVTRVQFCLGIFTSIYLTLSPNVEKGKVKLNQASLINYRFASRDLHILSLIHSILTDYL